MRQQSVAQLGLEPGGLGRHDAAGVARSAIRSSTLTGCIENATARLPERTSCSSAAVPRAPPTKSMRGSVRDVADAEQRRQHRVLQPADVEPLGRRQRRRGGSPSVDRVPLAARGTSTRRRGRAGTGGPSVHRRTARAARREATPACAPPRSLHHAVVGEHLHLRRRETPRPETCPSRPVAVAARRAADARARRAGGAVMTVGDVERRHRRERADRARAASPRSTAPDRVLHAVAASKSKSGALAP